MEVETMHLKSLKEQSRNDLQTLLCLLGTLMDLVCHAWKYMYHEK